MTSKVSILPPSVSELERDLELALARIEQVEIPTSTIWDADNCPEPLLPYLAWALRVDSWDIHWPAATKRQVIKDSIYINRMRGTRGAVERAISSIRGDDVILVEWFEDEANLNPGEFRVDVISSQTPIDGLELKKLEPTINRAKNTRSHLKGISITSRVEAHEKLGTLSRQGIAMRAGPWAISSVVSSSSSVIGCFSRQGLAIKSGPWVIRAFAENPMSAACISRMGLLLRSGPLPLVLE
ncbi:phage tail protein I [Vibrio parahaemolyticus]|nr:phage tail protein I [Vibrio parahaemolyticus]